MISAKVGPLKSCILGDGIGIIVFNYYMDRSFCPGGTEIGKIAFNYYAPAFKVACLFYKKGVESNEFSRCIKKQKHNYKY